LSTDNALKERLSRIAQNDYHVLDKAEVWPLAVQMMQSLGSVDPELRDALVCSTLSEWAELYFDAHQLRILLNKALDAEHLFLGLGEQGTDTVFMRSFSSLAIAGFVNQHLKRSFLTAEEVGEMHRRFLSYLSQELDLRGHVRDKGWAHAVAHAADALSIFVQCPELRRESLLDTLGVIRETIEGAVDVLVDEEDERLVSPVLSILEREVLTREDLEGWVSDFGSFKLPPTWAEWTRKRTNIKHFLRSLYFRSFYRGVLDSFEPVLGQMLQEISERGIPPTYF